MKTWVISLAQRTDRREGFLGSWEAAGFEGEPVWVDGVRPDAGEILWAEMRGMEAYGKDAWLRTDYVVGAVGCKRAGIAALEVFLESGEEWGMVCQDDCRWDGGAAAKVASAECRVRSEKGGAVDMVYFSAHSRKRNVEWGEGFVRLGGARNCTAIAFRRGYVEEMLPRLRVWGGEWDLFMEREHAGKVALCVWPMVARQAKGFSDITRRVVEQGNR